MNRKIIVLLVAFTLALSGFAEALTKEDFEAQTTRELIDLCTASVDDPYYAAAIHFCHGYLVGAFDYYKAANEGPEGENLVCFPNPPPSRNEAVEMFVNWAKAHPQYMSEAPVETEFRFLMEKWPCNKK